MNFRQHRNRALRSAPKLLPNFSLPETGNVGDTAEWERYLRRLLNFFYGCGAVHSVTIGARGMRFYEWEIELCEGNVTEWLKPHLKVLRDRIRLHIQEARHDDCVMERLIVKAPGAKTIASPVRSLR